METYVRHMWFLYVLSQGVDVWIKKGEQIRTTCGWFSIKGEQTKTNSLDKDNAQNVTIYSG